MGKKITVNLDLPGEIVAFIQSVATLAHVSFDDVVAVLLAMRISIQKESERVRPEIKEAKKGKKK